MKITVRDVNYRSNVVPFRSPMGGASVQQTPVVSKQKTNVIHTDIEYDEIERAKSMLKEGMKSGTKCPCCGQFVKLYRRSINATMARALLLFYKKTHLEPTKYFHLFDVFKDEKDPTVLRGDFAKLRFWGLVEESPSEKDPSKKAMGSWRLTKAGHEFVEAKRKVAKYVFVYNNQVEGFGTDMVTIIDSLKTPFDYRSVMGHDVTDVHENLYDYRMYGSRRVIGDGTCVMDNIR